MRKISTSNIFVFAAALLAGTPALAAEQGTLGATSTGSITLSGTLENPPNGTRISGLTDISFGTISQAFNGNVYTDQICIFHSSPTFRITLSQAGVPTPRLLGPNGGSIQLDVGLAGLSGTTPEFFSTGGTTTGLVGNRESPTCLTGPSQQFQAVYLLPPTAQPEGAYSATITLQVAVE